MAPLQRSLSLLLTLTVLLAIVPVTLAVLLLRLPQAEAEERTRADSDLYVAGHFFNQFLDSAEQRLSPLRQSLQRNDLALAQSLLGSIDPGSSTFRALRILTLEGAPINKWPVDAPSPDLSAATLQQLRAMEPTAAALWQEGQALAGSSDARALRLYSRAGRFIVMAEIDEANLLASFLFMNVGGSFRQPVVITDSQGRWIADNRGLGDAERLGLVNNPAIVAMRQGQPLPASITLDGLQLAPVTAREPRLGWILLSGGLQGLDNPGLRATGVLMGGVLAVALIIVLVAAPLWAGRVQRIQNELERQVRDRTRDLAAANAGLEKALESLRSAQRQLVQSEKQAALGRMVAGVAHELNTPLGNGLMAVSTLQESTRRFSEQVRSGLTRSALDGFVIDLTQGLMIAERNARRAADMIASLKQVSADQGSDAWHAFDLSERLTETLLTLQPMLRRSGVTVQTQLGERLTMMGYPGAVEQVLSNLVLNAVHHAFDGIHEPVINVTATALGEDRVRLEVSDNGCGMDEALQARAFEPFVTTRLGQGGTGLGLHIVQTLVTGPLRGELQLRSAPGQGCTFTLDLPRRVPPPADDATAA